MKSRILCLFFLMSLVGCEGRQHLAPVIESKWRPISKYQAHHRVSRGETLYAIAFRYDTDYRTLAQLNHLRPPYSLRVGQVLNVHTPGRARPSSRPVVRTPSYSAPIYQAKPIYTPTRGLRTASGWVWPVSGRVATTFIPNQGKKGINIACKKGEKIHAALNGVVAYAGSGLAGYGNLIIIKHNNEFLTAYGNNARNLVSEGQKVNAGQVIAEAGVIDHQYVGVHFEIRKAGKPVNPLNYLR